MKQLQMNQLHNITQIDAYEQFTGAKIVERVRQKAAVLGDLSVAHLNSTNVGGGVAEILSSLTLLMNSIGIDTEWRVLEGPVDFFGVTKKIHNALQGSELHLEPEEQQLYEEVVYENSLRNNLEHDRIVVHDPQPLPLINHYERKSPWIWQCHIDLTNPNQAVLHYLRQFIEKYDTAIFSLEQYAQALEIPQLFIKPAIDPFVTKNRPMSEDEIQKCLDEAGIPTDLPLVTQISRFDRWKDPEGVIRAFRQARTQVDATLVLLGSSAADDPEGDRIYRSLLEQEEERIIILSVENPALVNALQRRAAVVLQKSLREGFGLTVSEAMWKGTPVIGGKVGGIPEQIKDGENGFLVSSVEEAADRIVLLLQDPSRREAMGRKAHETVKKNFLLIRLLEQYLDLLGSFERSLQPA